MATNTVLLRLVLVTTLTTMTTLAGKGFRLRTLAIQQRARGYSPAARMTDVLDRLDQLTALVNDLQATVDEVHATVKTIDADVDPAVVTPCDVYIQSVGYWESETTYVKLNDYYPLELASPADENDQECGTYTVLLDKTSCRIKELKFFDTHDSGEEADKLAMYLDQLPDDEHLIVMTLGEAFANMTERAFDALCSAGVDIADVADEGQTLAALVVVGSHCRTVYELYEHDPAYLDLQLNGDTERTSYFTYKRCDREPCECPVPESKQ